MLHLHRAPHADALVAALGDVLLPPPPDPMAAEVVAVPTRGMERWLAQRLSARLGATPGRADGVCANVRFPSPRRLVDDAVASALGLDPATDPWRPEHAVWPLLRVVDAHLAEDWLAPLAIHLGGAGDAADPLRRRRRFASVRHLARLYDRYALLRPGMLRAWAAGDDADATGERLGPVAWQAGLWRRLREEIGAPDPAERLEDACSSIRERPASVVLPDRLACFGLTRVPAGHVAVLDALAAGREVHLLLLHPSPALWARAAPLVPAGVPARAQDPTAELPRNRLLGSWGRDARELQLVAARGAHADRPTDVPRPDPATLLERLQADVRGDVAPPGEPAPGHDDARPLLGPEDRSVLVHACHGPQRQVEVLREAILHALAEDPTLEPRDVVVLCPDIEAFAPLIQAAFGTVDAGDEDDGTPAAERPPDLRVRLADRALRRTNPVLGVLARLLELAEGRVTASDVLDLADREPVRRRFGLDDDDLARMREWVSASGVRWGLDARRRAPFLLQDVEENTWRAGLDRLLLGAAMAEDGHRRYAGVLPLDDVESGALDLAGRVAELVERLGGVLDALAGERPVAAWTALLAEAAEATCDVPGEVAWQRGELLGLLRDVSGEAEAGGGGATSLTVPEVRALLGDRLEGRPTHANFRSGHLTMCTLVPMRSVPHRVVCLLGLDDGAFPRRSPRDGDDLVLAEPHVGDPEGRSQDRQMLLDALLAAGERLIVTYAGADERTNAVRPPAVPVGELLDAVERTVRTAEGTSARERVVVRHPLQPFDPRNFVAGGLVPDVPWGFDATAREGAAALAGERPAPAPFLDAPLPATAPAVVGLEDLVRFVAHPARSFLRRRLDVSLAEHDDEVDDALPVEVEPLERWAIGDRLLRALLAGVDWEAATAAERARGTLPPGALREPLEAEMRPGLEAIVAAVGDLGAADGPATAIDVRVPLAGGRLLTGTVPGVHGDVLRTTGYSRVGPKHRLAAWVRLLALAAAAPAAGHHAVVVGRASPHARRGATVTLARLRPPDDGPGEAAGSRAVGLLEDLVDLMDRGAREPLPLACRTAAAHAGATGGRGAPADRARDAWEGSFRVPGEQREAEHLLVLGGSARYAAYAGAPAHDEAGPGWDDGEPTRLGRLARRLWGPLLEHERLEDR